MARRQRGDKIGGGFVPMLHQTLDCAAWRSLSPIARLVYMALKRRARPETNGHVFLSIRDAAEECGAHRNTVMRAFRELQAHGFLVATKVGHLGAEGLGKATTWRLTEIGYPGGGPTKEYLRWLMGQDFPVALAVCSPKNQKPGTSEVQARHKDCAVSEHPGTNGVPSCHEFGDVPAIIDFKPVTSIVPHLEYAIGDAKADARRARASAQRTRE